MCQVAKKRAVVCLVTRARILFVIHPYLKLSFTGLVFQILEIFHFNDLSKTFPKFGPPDRQLMSQRVTKSLKRTVTEIQQWVGGLLR